jgi:hypothetical protein
MTLDWTVGAFFLQIGHSLLCTYVYVVSLSTLLSDRMKIWVRLCMYIGFCGEWILAWYWRIEKRLWKSKEVVVSPTAGK